MERKVIRLGGLYDTDKRLKERGAIYEISGIAPCLNCCGGVWYASYYGKCR